MTLKILVTPESTWAEAQKRIKTSDVSVLANLQEQFVTLHSQVSSAASRGASCNIRQESELGGLKVLFIARDKKPSLLEQIKNFLS